MNHIRGVKRNAEGDARSSERKRLQVNLSHCLQCLFVRGCEETCDVVYHFYMDRTFGIHACLYDVLVLYKRDTTYGISQYLNGGLQIFVLELEAWCQFMWTWATQTALYSE